MSKTPPVPAEQRSNKGPGSDPNIQVKDPIPGRENFDQQAVTATSNRIQRTRAINSIDEHPAEQHFSGAMN